MSLNQLGDGGEVRHLHLHNSNVNSSDQFLDRFPNLSLLKFSSSNIECSESTVWLLKISHLIENLPRLYCASPEVLKDTPITKALHLIRQVSSQCPEQCVCQLLNVPKDDQYVTVTIDCVNQGLVELPRTLPSNVTIHLDLSENKIENLDDLVTNPSYSRVTHLYLNNNQIKTISSLDDSDWIKHFSLLSLTGNYLQEISTEALSNAFRRQDINGIRMFLGQNPWHCDCYKVTHFQSFSAKHKSLIKDIGNVTCGPNEGENAGKKIVAVERSSVCRNPDAGSINLMDVLNVFLALITVCTVGKLLYDYYAYRKTGQLPWLASKMP